MNATRDDRELTAIAEKAAWWFVTNRSESVSPAEREAFCAWLRESPAHVREYLAIATVARDLASSVHDPRVELASQPEPVPSDWPDNVVELNPSLATSKEDKGFAGRHASRRLPRFAAAALVASVALVVWFLVADGIPGTGRIYRTGHGEQQTVQLADGSVLRLNSDSIVAVRFSSAERRVELKAGQALLDVAREPARRFRVLAGGVSVVAIGTRFDVYRRRGATIVTVVEGKVAVAPTMSALPIVSLLGGNPDTGVAVTAGEQVRVERRSVLPDFLEAGGSISKSTAVNVEKAVAWVRQQIIFEQQALAEVAEEFNRYGVVPIRIEDAQLRHMRVTGILSTYDTEAFIGFLRRLDGVDVVETPTAIRVTRSPRSGSAESTIGPG